MLIVFCSVQLGLLFRLIYSFVIHAVECIRLAVFQFFSPHLKRIAALASESGCNNRLFLWSTLRTGGVN